EIKLLKSSFNTTFVSFIIKNNFYKDIDEFLNACEVLIKNKIEFYLKKHKGIKINMCLNLKLKSSRTNEIVDYSTWGEKTNEGRVILLADNHSLKTDKVINSIRNRVLQQNAGDSSFVLYRIDFRKHLEHHFPEVNQQYMFEW